jgi:hypothetical protein
MPKFNDIECDNTTTTQSCPAKCFGKGYRKICKYDTTQPQSSQEAIGRFVELPNCRLGFQVLYRDLIQNENGCCSVTRVTNEQPFEVNQSDGDTFCYNFVSYYRIEYMLTDIVNIRKSDYVLIDISSVNRIQPYEYQGRIKRYTVGGSDMYVLITVNYHEIQIMNPEVLPQTPVNNSYSHSTKCGSCVSNVKKSTNHGYITLIGIPLEKMSSATGACKGRCGETTTIAPSTTVTSTTVTPTTTNSTTINEGITTTASGEKCCGNEMIHIHEVCNQCQLLNR